MFNKIDELKDAEMHPIFYLKIFHFVIDIKT